MRPTLYALTLMVFMSAGALGKNLPDLLDIPAEQSARTLHGLMLDITRAGDRLVAVGEYGAILYSDDDGASWSQAEVPVQVALTSLFFATPQKGWAVGHDAVILHTENGGESWSLQLSGRQTGELLIEGAENYTALVEELAAAGEMDEDSLLMLEDAAMMAMDEAQREAEVGPNRPFMDVWFADENNGFVVGAFNYFFATDDGGKTWRDVARRLPNPEFLHLYSIGSPKEGVLVIAGEFGLILRSLDGGATWEASSADYEGTLFTISAGEGETWIGGLRGNIFHSDDDGETWTHIKAKTEASVLGAYAGGDRQASFVGLTGTRIDIDLDANPQASLSKPARGSLAGIIADKQGGHILVGVQGILRVDANGKPVPSVYIDSEAKQ